MVSARRAGSSMARHLHQHLGRDALVELDVGLEDRVHASAPAPRARPSCSDCLLDLLDLDQEERRRWAGSRSIARAAHALDQHLHRAVGQRQQLDDVAQGAEVEDVVRRGSLVFAFFCAARRMIALSSGALVGHRLLQRGDRLLAADEERHHHVREHDDVPQRQERDRLGGPSGRLSCRLVRRTCVDVSTARARCPGTPETSGDGAVLCWACRIHPRSAPRRFHAPCRPSVRPGECMRRWHSPCPLGGRSVGTTPSGADVCNRCSRTRVWPGKGDTVRCRLESSSCRST